MRLIHPYGLLEENRDGDFWAEETDTSFSQRLVFPNQSVFHVLYFTIVEAMFALDGNSYHREEIVQRGNDIFSLLTIENYINSLFY